MRATIVAVVLLVGGAAWAQDEATARKGLERFLKDVGESADGARLERAARREMFAQDGRYVAVVDSRSGDVRFFSRSSGSLYVSSTAEDRAATVRKRAKLSLDETEERARALLEARYPAFKERTFALTNRERQDQDGLIEDSFEFEEKPRKGVVAIWPNRCCISVNPETGAIGCYAAFDRRIESVTKPRLDKKAALRAAAAFAKKSGAAAPTDARLVALDAPKGPRTAWLAGGVLVDALDGTCRELE